MAQPLVLRSSLTIALITALQILLPGLAIAFALFALVAYHGLTVTPFMSGLAAVTWLLVGLAFRRDLSGNPELRLDPYSLMANVFVRWIALATAIMAIGYLCKLADYFPRRVIIPWLFISPVVASLVLLALQWTLRRTALSRTNQRTALMVGVTTASVLLASRLRQHPEFCSRVIGFVDDRAANRLEPIGEFNLVGKLAGISELVRREGVNVIFIALPVRHVERVIKLVDDLQDSTASIYYVPDLFVFDLIQSRTTDIEGVPVVAMRETPFYGYRGVAKRLLDFGITLLSMPLVLPLMAIIAALVKLDSKGPAFFKQRRYGLDGEEIVVYKFRSMRVTEDGAAISQATRDDPRITRLGRILRKYSLDEIPQLINVLQGRMSLVGPRPHAVAHNETYRGLIKGYMVRHKVLPGVTGLAQVHGYRGETQDLALMEARVHYDIEYLRRWTPWLDVKIILLTAGQLLGHKSAY
jgi:putative colanic acid biosysnthesis UDP-glucose lipid carrier transferase